MPYIGLKVTYREDDQGGHLMRIVLDLQSVQDEFDKKLEELLFLELVKKLTNEPQVDQIIILLNSLYPRAVQAIRSSMRNILNAEAIQVLHLIGPVNFQDKNNQWHQHMGECMYASVIKKLKPDILLIMDLLQGYSSDAVWSLQGLGHSTLIMGCLSGKYGEIALQPSYQNWINYKSEELQRLDQLLVSNGAQHSKQLNNVKIFKSIQTCKDVDAIKALILSATLPTTNVEQEKFENEQDRLLKAMASKTPADVSYSDRLNMVNVAIYNVPSLGAKKQIFYDVSELIRSKLHTGIQRVARNILHQLFINPIPGYQIEPVYTPLNSSVFYYARDFARDFLDSSIQGSDAPIDYQSGDVFLGVDLNLDIGNQKERTEYLEMLHCLGVKFFFVVHDSIPINYPQFFPELHREMFKAWLDKIVKFENLICVSQTTANSVSTYYEEAGLDLMVQPKVNWFHLGADMLIQSNKVANSAGKDMAKFFNAPCFLMVGTLEPRKGHQLVLDAFEALWESGLNVNLIIVGKAGWNIKPFIKRIKKHSRKNKQLFWLNNADDAMLTKLYQGADALIAASEIEGFGLPLIEAANYQLPIIARDIPIFREVAGDHAYYFNGSHPFGLTNAIKSWLELYKNNQHPKTAGMKWLTWEQSANRIKNILLHGKIEDVQNPSSLRTKRSNL